MYKSTYDDILSPCYIYFFTQAKVNLSTVACSREKVCDHKRPPTSLWSSMAALANFISSVSGSAEYRLVLCSFLPPSLYFTWRGRKGQERSETDAGADGRLITLKLTESFLKNTSNWLFSTPSWVPDDSKENPGLIWKLLHVASFKCLTNIKLQRLKDLEWSWTAMQKIKTEKKKYIFKAKSRVNVECFLLLFSFCLWSLQCWSFPQTWKTCF